MDRTSLVPSHEGRNVLPNSPLFGKLLRHARRDRLAIRDVRLGVEKTYRQLLSDALTLRSAISERLGRTVLEALRQEEEVYIGVLAGGGYEFAVAVIAILALGAAVVPISTSVSLEEAKYFIDKAKITLVLTSEESTSLGNGIDTHVNAQHNHVHFEQILPHLNAPPVLDAAKITISSGRMWDENAAGVVIFTSGTTGRPKGVVMRRYFTHETALAIGDGYDLDHQDVLLHILPVHHTTGLGTSFFAFLVAGACIEFRSGSFDAEWAWNRLIQGGVTVFSGVPTIYQRLQWFYEQKVASLPSQDSRKYKSAAKDLRVLMCGSSALQQPVQEFWTQLRDGRPILTRYGASEYPGCIKIPVQAGGKPFPAGCVGMPVPGVDVKLSDGDSELLVRSPHMFSKYLFDEHATGEAHDKNGYFKTGDIARREGEMYFIVGRASVDIIKSGGYKISAPDIERECLQLPYVSEVVVVGVDDQEFGQRVGVIISVKANVLKAGEVLNIRRLRDDLRSKLSSYKLPTLLRVVEGELPKGQTGKLQKKVLGPKFFPPGRPEIADVQRWSLQEKAKL